MTLCISVLDRSQFICHKIFKPYSWNQADVCVELTDTFGEYGNIKKIQETGIWYFVIIRNLVFS